MKKFFTTSVLLFKLSLLIIFSGMHFAQTVVFAKMPCQKMMTENISKNIETKNCNLCKNIEKLWSLDFISASELKEVSKNSEIKYLTKTCFTQNILEKKLLVLKLKKNYSPPFQGFLQNYLSFKKSVELRV